MNAIDFVEEVKKELRTLERPPDVGEADVTLGLDSTGDKAIWISFSVGGKDEYDAFLDKLNAFAQEVTSKLLRLYGSDQWPYVRYRR